MRLLPCRPPAGEGRPAQSSKCRARGYALLPDGSPYTMGRAPLERMSYKCASCRRVSSLSPQEFTRLPSVNVAALIALGVEDRVLNDLVGAGLTQEQAIQALDSAELTTLHNSPVERGIQ